MSIERPDAECGVPSTVDVLPEERRSACDKPFEIEEIYPGRRSPGVRLPRRQAGSSPQGVAVTLLADYTLRTRAWLPSAAIVALLGETGRDDGRGPNR